MRQLICCLGVLVLSGCMQAPAEPNGDDFLEPFRARAVADWEDDIQRFEARDAVEAHPDDAILFVGSSSIRLWETLAADMAPYPVIQRGYGGARYSDMAVYAARLIEPHDYRAMVMFVANDVSGEARDHSPEQVGRFVRYILDIARSHRPRAPIFIVEITPTESRFNVWTEIRKVNATLREIALTTDNTYFIPTAEYYLDASGNPRPEFFVDDRLHLNADGYALWTKLIRRRLNEVLGG
ncbi:MAG: GDSL-type esterase/lipase family protein [Woeseiaceae bacterium]|nr:GDSL-type esterase/lipase family protein [Woeseiaceae bacterium]